MNSDLLVVCKVLCSGRMPLEVASNSSSAFLIAGGTPLKIAKVSVALLGVSLLAAGLFAEEGMWMPQQIPEMAAKLRALGFKGDPKTFADLSAPPMGS